MGCVLLFFALSLLAASAPPGSPLGIQYRLQLARPSTHLIGVEIDVTGVRNPSLDFVMPAWAPGRYAIYNFAKNVQQFTARGANGQSLPWETTDKQTWRVNTQKCGGLVTVRYRVFANDLTGSFSQFDTSHAAINGAGVYMYVAGHKSNPVTLRVDLPANQHSASAIYSGFSLSTSQTAFQAANYDRLIDTPMEISAHCEQTQFQDHGKLFRIVMHAYGGGSEGATQWTKDLARSLRKIVHCEMAMMPAPDFQAYTFLFHVSPFISEGDGMEHLNSTDIIVRGSIGADTLSEALEIAAHEFFHVWNVKRLRPAGLGPFDYRREVYTRSLWFAEGLTSYYSYVMLLRAGIWGQQDFFDRLAGEIRQFHREPGRRLMSAEQSSFDAWFYDRAPQMQETNFANSTISYYNKGAVLGLLLDLAVRERTHGRKSLDNVLRSMYQKFYEAPPSTYYLPGKGYTEQDILDALNLASGADFTAFFKDYIRGTDPLPYAQILGGAGLRLSIQVAPGSPPSLGILAKPVDTGLRIMSVRPGSAADRAGLSRDDVLIAVDQLSLATHTLSDRLSMYPPGAEVPFTVERNGERRTITVKLDPPAANDYRIEAIPDASPQQIRIRQGWLRTSEMATGAGN
ncbi:MAG TPA: PDZ domain-containing protein [Terriglobia bacterium]|nr:PDZ domain-containing protein [Terriglobia bacterium]